MVEAGAKVRLRVPLAGCRVCGRVPCLSVDLERELKEARRAIDEDRVWKVTSRTSTGRAGRHT